MKVWNVLTSSVVQLRHSQHVLEVICKVIFLCVK